MAADNLAQAIGRGGQNVRLASQLTGWTLNVMTESDIQAKQQAETGDILRNFIDELEVDEELAQVLVDEGFTSLEEIAYVPLEEMLNIDGFDEEIVNELRARAKDRLLTKAIATEEKLADAHPAEDLLSLEGMDNDLASGTGGARRGYPRRPGRAVDRRPARHRRHRRRACRQVDHGRPSPLVRVIRRGLRREVHDASHGERIGPRGRCTGRAPAAADA